MCMHATDSSMYMLYNNHTYACTQRRCTCRSHSRTIFFSVQYSYCKTTTHIHTCTQQACTCMLHSRAVATRCSICCAHRYKWVLFITDVQHNVRLSAMGWLRLLGSFKIRVSFAQEPYTRDYILQKRTVILRGLLIPTPYQR